MKNLKKHPKQQRMEDMTFPVFNDLPEEEQKKIIKGAMKIAKELQEHALGRENDRCKECGAYPGDQHLTWCPMPARNQEENRVTMTGREYLRSINDDLGFTLMPRIVWRVVAVGVLVVAVIYFLSTR